MKTQEKDEKLQEQLHKAATAITKAEALLITAGAGMGVDSGLPDFRGKQGFWRAYPAIQKKGLAFEEMANPTWFQQDPRFAWGFYGHRHNLYQNTTPHPGFAQLLAMGQTKTQGYFVLTSNVDGQFQAAGFDPERITECHGSIHYLQCTQPCRKTVWSDETTHISIDSESLKAIGTLPVCPTCNALARPNILLFNDRSWVEQRTKEQEERLCQWLEALMVQSSRLVIIEIGAGKAVPTIRLRSEFYAKIHHATLIRINPDDSHVFKGRHISLPLSGQAAIAAILANSDGKNISP